MYVWLHEFVTWALGGGSFTYRPLYPWIIILCTQCIGRWSRSQSRTGRLKTLLPGISPRSVGCPIPSGGGNRSRGPENTYLPFWCRRPSDVTTSLSCWKSNLWSESSKYVIGLSSGLVASVLGYIICLCALAYPEGGFGGFGRRPPPPAGPRGGRGARRTTGDGRR
jgi:hypothetical protein